MKEPNANNSTPQFLKTDGGKTKSNAIEIPSISLPKGGGSIKGIDENFSVNAVNGTAALSIPLPFSAARNALVSLSLSYNSGAGNGVFGLGWNLSLVSIKRKTDTALPQYLDSIESDTFLFSEAESLVPEFKKEADGGFSLQDGDYVIYEKSSPDGLFIIRFYKPRIEGLFIRIERWIARASGRIKWRVTTKDNTTTLFGWSDDAVIADPNDNSRIFEWLPEFVFDDKGNCAQYVYKKEDATGFDHSLLHHKNRFKDGDVTYTNTYVERVLYGNRTPFDKFGDAFPLATDYLFQTVFDYGEYNSNAPYTATNDWDFRTDAFSEHKSGFEIRTTRLCKRVLLFHYFNELPGGSALVKSINFGYDKNAERDFTFLKSITSAGYIKKADGSYTSKSLPATEFAYQKHEWNSEVKAIATEDLIHAPSGPDEQQYLFTDLFNEGLAGILTEQAAGWYYKHNLGGGRFERARLVSPKPSFTGLGGQLQLTDLDADGGRQLASLGVEPKGYFELDDDNDWQPFKTFHNLPNIDLGDANTRMLDLNGDGKSEILITGEHGFTWYKSEGRKGYSRAHKTLKPFDEETGPAIVFSDQKQTIFLADMSGDGLTDIVRIRNGEVCYWPNLGYGKFGAKVAMDDAPLFDSPDSFHPSFLRLADIDGSGTTDIIYLGKNKFTCYLNLSGNRFSTAAFETDAFPEIHSAAKITVTDLLGNGVACIVWSSSLSKDAGSPLKYIDLMNSKKPHIMVFYKNNLGKEVTLEYAPSTKFYIEDKLAGRPWATKLHFPVHCIFKTETIDKISGWRFVSAYKYHHGYYDHPEREFRGFGMVEQTDTEHFEHWSKGTSTNIVDATLHQQPVVSKSWFHTGAFMGREKILSQAAHEYWFEEMARQGFPAVHHEIPLPDAHVVAAPGIPLSLIEQLSAVEWREALRACKGMALRSEVFAHDAPEAGASAAEIKKQLTPYSVATHNCVIELLQPKGKNKHAVFAVKESEAITYSYERDTADPRIAHNLNISLDEYGNVLESAAVVYPRVLADVSLPQVTQDAQDKTVIIYTQNRFTDDSTGDDAYRLRLPAEVKTFELRGVTKTGSAYSISDFQDILDDLKSSKAEYHELDKPLIAGKAQKRLIEHVRTNYRKNDLSAALPLGKLESLGLPFESYQLAYTPELLTDIYSAKADDMALAGLMEEGRFCHSIDERGHEDLNLWVRSGTMQFTEGVETATDARVRFFVPVSYTDPYGSKTRVKYYGNYFLFVKKTVDELGNKSRVDLFNFRTLSPQRMKDINGNLSEAITDELGLVKAMAVMGKDSNDDGIGEDADDLTGLAEWTDETETALVNSFFSFPETPDGIADSESLIATGRKLLRQATARFVYDFDVYKNTGGPAVVASIVREEHSRKNPDSAIQLSFEYSNGLDKVVMKKVQAEPGPAKKVIVQGEDTITMTNIDTSDTGQLRWIGNGRTILNNKGNPVKQYEPYFSVTPRYEDFKELVETGVTPIMYYDAAGRLVKTEMPDGSFSKVAFDSWQQTVYDANDTVKDSLWYLRRTDSARADFISDAGEQAAAVKAAAHYGTPSQLHFDTLGRPVLQVEHNGKDVNGNDVLYKTKIDPDVEGNLRKVTDARELPENAHKGNTVMQYKYDMLGNLVYQSGTDAGRRWLLHNALGNPLRTWDERGHEFRYFYDALHRPTESKVLGGDGSSALDHVFDRIIYGESLLLPGRSNEATLQVINILGKPARHYDTGGVVRSPEYDFQGQPVFTTRQLFRNYKSIANWIDENLEADLEEAEFTFTTETDALGRISRQTAPDGSIIIPAYNATGLLNGESVTHVDPAITTTYIKDIDYNEKGERSKIVYGNDVRTKFTYDKETFRLKRLETVRAGNDPLQDWHYTFDPVGNVTRIEDRNSPKVFYNNWETDAVSEYTYDALYRLIKATGRENAATLHFANEDNWSDADFMHQMNPGDPMAIRRYIQRYQYDEVGNILQMKHRAAGNRWTRDYDYEKTNNRLTSTSIGSDTFSYSHHSAHGFMTAMPHLEDLDWNFKEEIVRTIRQQRKDGGTPETTYYQYDGEGQRIRKITENAAAAGNEPARKEERIYIAGYELYKKHDGSGLERRSLSLLDEGHRFVMMETRNGVNDGTEEHLVRYQLHNHLGSAALELDTTAQVISYEEYHPFGTTAYQSKNASIKSAAKRYRYTGMERDEETGLEYHAARYYLSWLGRWCSADPIGIGDGVNVYIYVHDKPLTQIDRKGNQSQYKINKGDNFYNLENKYNLAHGTLQKLNPAVDPIKLKIGSTIKLSNDITRNNENHYRRTLQKPKLNINSTKIEKQNPYMSITVTKEIDAMEVVFMDSDLGDYSSIKAVLDWQVPEQKLVNINRKIDMKGIYTHSEMSINVGPTRLTVDPSKTGAISMNVAIGDSRIGIKTTGDLKTVFVMQNRNPNSRIGITLENSVRIGGGTAATIGLVVVGVLQPELLPAIVRAIPYVLGAARTVPQLKGIPLRVLPTVLPFKGIPTMSL